VSYQVLARKWRPRKFAELVGQTHVVEVLSNGLAAGRIHHAFLFTGTRGVGKTTIARILAKSLNCLEGVSAEPCGECAHCVAIDEGRFVDLLEVDAASRTKVDDTREILDNVQYAPAQGRYKVYLIDEVHMLSKHSFNALLKTLEEPPEHVKFVLATTDPHSIPVTILSRCLQFNLKRLDVEQIEQQLATILQAEGVSAEPAALRLLAQAADGSMRDGLSLLDQALSASGGLSEPVVAAMLGTIEQRHVQALLDALTRRDGQAALQVVAEVFGMARDLGRLLADLAEALHRIALIQTVPDYRDDARQDWDQMVALAGQMDPQDVQLFYQIALTGRKDLDLAPSARTGCEMTVLRMLAFQPAAGGVPGSASGTAGSSIAERPGRSAQVAPSAETAAAPIQPGQALTPERWPTILSQLSLTEAVRSQGAMLALIEVSDVAVVLSAAEDDLMMISERARKDLSAALVAYCQRPLKVRFEAAKAAAITTPAELAQQDAEAGQAAAEAAIEGDPLVQRLRRRFDAEVVPESVRPAQTRSH